MIIEKNYAYNYHPWYKIKSMKSENGQNDYKELKNRPVL